MADVHKTTETKSLRVQHTKTLAELERYKLLVESVQDYAIFLLDPSGYILTWNKGAERFKGYKPHEIIGKHFSQFYLERDIVAKKPERELELAKKFGHIEDEDWRVRKDGSQFWANVIITALYDPSGKHVGFAKVTRDLTERKQQEDELRKANTLLRQQQRELERLNAIKDEFISLASHQLRTPATSIKQFLGMLIEGFRGEVAPEQLDFIQKAYESNERQIAIVNSLLKVAQIDAGKVTLHKTATNIRHLLREIAEGSGDTFRARGQAVTVEASDITANVDPAYFRMAVENLVDNASKYTPMQGKITLRGRIYKDTLRVSIHDTGVGISPVDLKKLFEKFNRIPNALSEHVGGSGLGLYWADKVIALHGGRIEVTSQVNEGTTFTIITPLE